MKYNKEQLVARFIEDEKEFFDYTESEWEAVAGEYASELDKMGINGADKFDVVDTDYGTAIDLGLDSMVVVDGQNTMRKLYWYDEL